MKLFNGYEAKKTPRHGNDTRFGPGEAAEGERDTNRPPTEFGADGSGGRAAAFTHEDWMTKFIRNGRDRRKNNYE